MENILSQIAKWFTHKRARMSIVQPNTTYIPRAPELLDLPDELILHIVSNLESCDIIALSKTCRRLSAISVDTTLWPRIDFRDERFNEDSFNTSLKIMSPKTKSVAFDFSMLTTDTDEYRRVFSNLLYVIRTKSTGLHTLILEHAVLNSYQFKLRSLPPSLRYLSLKGSSFTTRDMHFPMTHINLRLPYLEVLILSECQWFNKLTFGHIWECKHLRELRLDGCSQLDHLFNDSIWIGYFDCMKLETIDLRRTRIGHRELQFYNRITSLKHLYLEAPEGGCLPGEAVSDLTVQKLLDRKPRHRVSGYLDLPPLCLETLVLRQFKDITNATLNQVSAVKTLRRLDVTGTGVTLIGVRRFIKLRLDVDVVSSFDSSLHGSCTLL